MSFKRTANLPLSYCGANPLISNTPGEFNGRLLCICTKPLSHPFYHQSIVFLKNKQSVNSNY